MSKGFSATAQRLNERVAEEFARRLLQQCGDQVEAIVLFGSVARGESHDESDIDVLVIAPDRIRMREDAVTVGDQLDSENQYKTWVLPLVRTADQWAEMARIGEPIVANIQAEGKVLFDNGVFAGTRREAVGAG